MTLEDFFTLAEMKNGLTAPARVEELVNVMQKESDCVVKNFAEAARQWSAVASTLAATESKDSLDLFIKLDGLQFLNHWLQKAQKCCDPTSDFPVEESITALLGALEKIPIDQGCSIYSGIVVTIKDLFGHKSSRVQDRARALFDSWNQGRVDSSTSNVDRNGRPCENEVSASAKVVLKSGSPEQSAAEISSFRGNFNAENHVLKSAGSEISLSRDSDGSKPGGIEDVKIQTTNNHDSSCSNLVWVDKDNGFKNSQDNISTKKSSSIPSVEGTASTEALGSPVSTEGDPDPQTQESVKESAGENRVGATEIDSCLKRFSDSNMSVLGSKLGHEVVDFEVPNHSESKVIHEATSEGGECCSNVLEDLSHDGNILRQPDNPKSFSCGVEDSGPVEDASEFIMEVGRGEVSVVIADVSKPKTNTQDSKKIGKRSDNEFQCEIDDPLEVARHVANESAQEVGNDGEPFSSSEKSYCKIEEPCSPDSVNGEQISEKKPKEALSDSASTQKEVKQLTSSNNADTEFEDIQDTVSSLVTESAQVASNSGKGVLVFDLNEEVNPVEMECPNTPISAPISSLAASITPDGYNYVERDSDSSEQRQDLLDFDLNVADGGADGAADTILTDQIPVSSCLLSGESSIEVSSRRAERHNLDLNRVGDNDDALSPHRRERKPFYHHLDERNNPSPAASSSSRQPFLINIDLNEDLSFVDDTYDRQTDLRQSSSQDMNSGGDLKQDDHVVWIMGARVEVNGKDTAPSESILPNGQSGISLMGTSLARQQGVVGLQRAGTRPTQLYGYNGFTMGPSTSLSAVYGSGSIPYMVDSRGAPVLPKIIGSAMAFPPTYSSQPFPMSMNSAPFNMNGVGPTRAAFDLNSSLMMMEDGPRELGGWRSGQSQLEECMWSSSQCSGPGLGVKRKEPDGGWEQYPVSSRQQLRR
ncbi:hypothetical protein L1049_015191 [Liquidambar formosana]|uniref:TFIIS N-terminal domain-containing protein n=1 Tax=Liquidambar formosana TaxID=63359 RepID=A0AAP0S3A3_LIQFO